ncbi:MAG: hypothetical protein VXY77_00645 [Pseudomonadota bacterium]|nr:hypothetical protein [Pseudomonadota bacterium]
MHKHEPFDLNQVLNSMLSTLQTMVNKHESDHLSDDPIDDDDKSLVQQIFEDARSLRERFVSAAHSEHVKIQETLDEYLPQFKEGISKIVSVVGELLGQFWQALQGLFEAFQNAFSHGYEQDYISKAKTQHDKAIINQKFDDLEDATAGVMSHHGHGHTPNG